MASGSLASTMVPMGPMTPKQPPVLARLVVGASERLSVSLSQPPRKESMERSSQRSPITPRGGLSGGTCVTGGDAEYLTPILILP